MYVKDSFSKYLVIIYCVSGTVSSTEDTAEDKRDNPVLIRRESTF